MPAAARKQQPEPVDRFVGARIRTGRQAAKMSQEKLANVLGLSFQQVQKYESGKNRIAPSRLALIAATLDVPVSYFFEGASRTAPGGDKAADAIDAFMTTAEGASLVRAFTDVKDSRTRRAILKLVQQVAESAGKWHDVSVWQLPKRDEHPSLI